MTSREHDELLEKMKREKEKWDAEEGQDDTDALLSQAIGMAIEQGKGWKEGEKEEYMNRIGDDDYIPPLFASTEEELEASGLAEAFTTLQYDDPPVILMQQSKQKGNDAFINGKKNVAKNIQVHTHYNDVIFISDKNTNILY